MRRFALFCSVALLLGCARTEDRPAEDVTTTAADEATISSADVAGSWKLRATDEAGGNVVETQLNATAGTTGWTWTRPDGTVVPLTVVAIAGDSIVLESGQYESALRAGVPVRSRLVFQLRENRLVGHIEARYMLSTGDSVAHRPAEGTRMP